jgi:arylsulfatase A-like enzyme
VDLSDIFPTLCELTGAKLPNEKIHGRSFAPQLLGKPGKPREWIHIQHQGARQVRNRDYMLDNKNQLCRVVELWENPAGPDEPPDTKKNAAARKTLKSVFDALKN